MNNIENRYNNNRLDQFENAQCVGKSKIKLNAMFFFLFSLQQK